MTKTEPPLFAMECVMLGEKLDQDLCGHDGTVIFRKGKKLGKRNVKTIFKNCLLGNLSEEFRARIARAQNYGYVYPSLP